MTYEDLESYSLFGIDYRATQFDSNRIVWDMEMESAHVEWVTIAHRMDSIQVTSANDPALETLAKRRVELVQKCRQIAIGLIAFHTGTHPLGESADDAKIPDGW